MTYDMKKVCKYILLGLLPLLTASCILDLDIVEPVQPGGNIVLDLSSGIQTKAIEYGSVGAEAYVNHVDLFIFGEQKNADGVTVNSHHERIAFNVTGNGTKTLGVKKVWFDQGQSYDVYVIANSTASEQTMSSITDVQGLWRLTQEDENLHVTGLHYGEGTQEDAVPRFFLMDGRGYTDEVGTEAVLNDGDMSANVVITAELARAAAKVVVELNKGDDVQYLDPSTQGVYYYRNLPYDTVVREADGIGYEISPKTVTHELEATNDYVAWGKTAGKITVTGYVYAYSWSELDKETSLVVNIPVIYDANGDGTFDAETETKANNFYKIPLSKERKFERNHIYKVTATVNAPGSESDFTPVEVTDLRYDTYSWTKIWPNITVGNETNKPKYLQLNTYHVDMYNINVDATTLEFSSSSYIPANTTSSTVPTSGGIRLVEAYYYNKYSQKTPLNSTIQATISSTAEQGVLNGKITITSPIVPKTQAEINAEIKALGPEPTPPQLPTIAEPSEPAGKPEEPTVVTQPSVPVEPDPDDYVKSTETEDDWLTRYTTEYRYIEANGNYVFQKRTGEAELGWGGYGETTWGDWTADAAAQAEYDAAYAEYESKQSTYDADMEAYNTYVNVTLPAYQDALAKWQQSAEGQAYLQQKAEYDAAMTVYNSEYAAYETALQEYNQKVADIEASAEGEETHYNTVRYLTFEVYNEQGMSATFTVAQYPVIYITNVVGWYSYRDDFRDDDPKPTTYQYAGDLYNYVSVADNDDTPSYNYGRGTGDGFWRSKVNRDANGSLTSDATSFNIDYYYWNSSGTSVDYRDAESGNARMYHIVVTATSKDYVVGRPKMVDASGNPTNDVENGVTESSAANAKLVSPSFMTASRLGFVNTSSGNISIGNNARSLAVVRDHCKNYVEVAADGTEYHDWRLPTAAEIGIILSLQGTGSGDMTTAIDYLLNAGYYYSASGPVQNSNVTSSGTSVRCVRDVY